MGATKISINGSPWTLEHSKHKGKVKGMCMYDEQRIRIYPRTHTDEKDLLDTYIHEFMHAANPKQAEGWTGEDAKNLAQLLWDLGYRQSLTAKRKNCHAR